MKASTSGVGAFVALRCFPMANQTDMAPPPNPVYMALDPERKAVLDELVTSTQQVQDDVDKHFAILGPVVFFLGQQILHMALRLEALEQRLIELEP